MAEKVGFEPTVPFDITGFQDRLLKPLGHLSVFLTLVILNVAMKKVKKNFYSNFGLNGAGFLSANL